MKVSDPKFSAVPPAAKVSTDAPVAKAAPVESVSTAQSERVASTLAQVKSQLPVDRAARVAEIAQAVKKGQYSPNPQQIATRIVEAAELEARLSQLLKQ